MSEIVIKTPKGKRKIGPGNPCFVIAEMSVNHQQNYDQAVAIIHAAAAAGADAIKVQTFTADSLTIPCDKPWFVKRGDSNPSEWGGQTLYELYEKASMPWEWQPKLKKIAEDAGLVFFSTPQDILSINFLEDLDVPCYKIASYEAVDLSLLKAVAQTKKPVIISVGFASREEIDSALQTLRANGATEIALLFCVTSYSDTPDYSTVNLKTMLDMREKYNTVVGFSDNNAGIDVPVIAATIGASIIEKHFLLEHSSGSLDDRFSLSTNEFKEMVDRIRSADKIIGSVHYGPQNDQEKQNLFFRRSLFVVKDVKKGEKFTNENVRSIRPSAGLPPQYLDKIIGSFAACDIEYGTPLSWDMIQKI